MSEHRLWRSLAVVPTVILVACASPGATSGGHSNVGQADVYLVVRNRTTVPVEFGFADPVPPCTDATLTLAQLNEPRPGHPDTSIWGQAQSLGVPNGTLGPVTVVVSTTGLAVSAGEVASDRLPPCAGTPPPEPQPQVDPSATF